MSGASDAIIGRIEEILPDGRALRQRIVASPPYGVTCERMSTNGNPAPIVDLAANRSAIVARHHSQGIPRYALDVIIGDQSVADLPTDEILARIIARYDAASRADRHDECTPAGGREDMKEDV